MLTCNETGNMFLPKSNCPLKIIVFNKLRAQDKSPSLKCRDGKVLLSLKLRL